MIRRLDICIAIALCCATVLLPAAAGEADAQTTSLPVTGFSPREIIEPAILRGSIDPDVYLVGPGDILSVTVWGSNVLQFSETVNPEGEVVLPAIATVPVAGMTLTDAKKAIADAVRKTSRNVTISTSLVQVRQMRVSVLGEVVNPGTYVGYASELASELVRKAGGLTEAGSRRNITIRRRDGGTEMVDLLRYRNLGDLSVNPPILDGDVIVVPAAGEYVFIYGAIHKPGTYEHVDGESVVSLIELAGGFARGAVTDTVELRVFLDSATTETRFYDLSKPADRELRLNDGDQLFIRSIPKWKEVTSVSIAGEVVFPGTYGINEDFDRLLNVIKRAGGLTELASPVDAKLVRTSGIDEIDLEFERLKKVPVEEMSDSEYDYFKTKSRERQGIVVVDFVELLNGNEEENVLLKNGDRITIPKRRETVAVSGQVANPGKLLFVPGENYKYYIERAGGYAHDARRSKARVIKGASGEWIPVGDAGPLVPGDVVYVPEKPERDWWQTVQDVARFAASIATVYLVIDQATQN